MAVSIVLVGCGKMGGALLGGWLKGGMQPSSVTVVEPNVEAGRIIKDSHAVRVVAGPDQIASDLSPSVIVFAVKPQIMERVIPGYARFVGSGCVYLSIAAGRTVAYFQRYLGSGAAIVRSMPNTPAAVAMGASVCVANQLVTDDQRRQCEELLGVVSEVFWVGDEGMMDAVTALSGSGPAYVFLLTECMAAAGVEAGLPKDMALELARLTVSGSGELMRLSDDGPETLRRNVTSPGGTTAAALDVLMEADGLKDIIARAMAAASQRSKELAG